jgi:hypothetical protein
MKTEETAYRFLLGKTYGSIRVRDCEHCGGANEATAGARYERQVGREVPLPVVFG